MLFNPDDPKTWPRFNPLIITHDVARTRDRATAVIGGNSPFQPRLLGIRECIELPQGLCGTPLASELAKIDRQYNSDAVIVFDASNDPTYAEVMFATFGPRVIGLHIGPNGDGMNAERRRVNGGAIWVYTIGRSYLLQLYHNELQADLVRLAEGPGIERACEQLENLETELRESGIVYRPPGAQHDDLGISCAMLAWAARHPHLGNWVNVIRNARRPRRPRPTFSAKAWT